MTLRLDLASISDWLHAQPGGQHVMEPGLGEDAGPRVSIALEGLAERLETELCSDPDAFSTRLSSSSGQAAFRQLAQHLSVGRRLRLLAWIIEAKVPNAGAILAGLFDQDAPPIGTGPALLADVRRLHRVALIDEIFAPDRTARVLAACQRGRL